MKLGTFRNAAIASVIATMTAVPFASAQEMKLADFLPPTHPFQEQVYGVLAERVAEATDGEVTIKIFPAGALGGNPAEQYDRALNGIADIAFAVPGYAASKFPMTLLTELPGVVEEQTATAVINENLEFLDDEYKRIKLLSLFTNGENVLFTRDKPVNSMADVQGMTIRVPSRNAGLVVESWGATPVSMPGPEAYNAMQTSVIDGILIDGSAAYGFRYIEIANYVSAGMNASISPLALYMNRDSYRDLSPEHQAEFDRIGKEIAVIANRVQLDGVARGRQMFLDAEGKDWIDLTPEAIAEFDAASASVRDDAIAAAEADGLNARAFVEALRK